MYEGKTVGVVVPAFNEERLISKTLTTMPDFVDHIVVVNDGSKDRTGEIIAELQAEDSRIICVAHEVNKGLGQSLIDGYLKARELECAATAVMAGDAQMSPDDLPKVVEPICRGEVDYVKGNRLFHDDVVERMPTHRFVGNTGLSLLTKFATGYWHVMDPQCGYTAISLHALETIPIEKMIKGYGYNAHILYMLNVNNFAIRDVEVEPIYGEEVSRIDLKKYVPRVAWLLTKLFFKRLLRKHAIRDFHPLFLFYGFSLFSALFVCLPLMVRMIYLFYVYDEAPRTTLIIFSFWSTNALFSFFFGIWMDMEENKKLRG